MLGTNYNFNQQMLFSQKPAESRSFNLFTRASRLFQSSLQTGWFHKLISRITGRSCGLMDLSSIEQQLHITSRYSTGTKAVAIRQIRGSEGRSLDFDAHFHPLQEHTRERWQNVMVARLKGVPLPAVELIQVGDNYFVRDGHHRISTAMALHQELIDAEVTVYTTSDRLLLKSPVAQKVAAQPAG